MNIDFRNKKVAVLGIGVEGVSSVRYLAGKGAEIMVLDRKEEGEIGGDILDELKRLRVGLITGSNYLELLKELKAGDIIVRSPGVLRGISELVEAEKKGVLVTSQTKLFFELCPCPVIGVTGTKGKGTTVSLIYEMLIKCGKDAYLGGNIGKPPFDFLDKLSPQSIVVLELSSFQIQDLDTSPHIAVMLMVTSEHLDYHGDTREYVEAKRNLLRSQTKDDFAILNRDYPATNESDILTDGQVYYVSRERGGERGCYVKDDAVWLQKDGHEKKVIDIKDILLPGRHNLENACAAVMAASLAGATMEDIRAALRAFKGLEHRLELVRVVNGVRYYDDSFSTTPETAIAAIDAFKEPEILILGGSGKKSDFTELGKVIGKAKNIKAIIGIGEEWERIKFQISNFKFQISNKNLPFLLIEGARDMKTIVQAAAKIAKAGDVVLLSPACASFGMFENYKDRGDQFKREVNKL